MHADGLLARSTWAWRVPLSVDRWWLEAQYGGHVALACTCQHVKLLPASQCWQDNILDRGIRLQLLSPRCAVLSPLVIPVEQGTRSVIVPQPQPVGGRNTYLVITFITDLPNRTDISFPFNRESGLVRLEFLANSVPVRQNTTVTAGAPPLYSVSDTSML